LTGAVLDDLVPGGRAARLPGRPEPFLETQFLVRHLSREAKPQTHHIVDFTTRVNC